MIALVAACLMLYLFAEPHYARQVDALPIPQPVARTRRKLGTTIKQIKTSWRRVRWKLKVALLFALAWPLIPAWLEAADREATEREIAIIKSVPMHYVSPSVPTLVQHLATANSGKPGGTLMFPSQFDFYLPNPTLPGNAVVFAMLAPSGVTLGTATDDAAYGGTPNTWNGPLAVTVDSGNGAQSALYYALNVVTGTRHITVPITNPLSASGISVGYEVTASEFGGIATSAAIDGSPVGSLNAATSAFTAGSITTTVAGDFIWCASFAYATAAVTNWAATGSGALLLSAKLNDSYCQSASQHQIKSVSGAINPGMTATGSPSGICTAIALQAATAGTSPPAFYVIRIQWESVYTTATSTATPFQFPCSGNCLVCSTDTGTTTSTQSTIATPHPITDSASNTWVIAQSSTSLTAGSPGPYQTAISYAGNATSSSTLTGTLTTSADMSESNFAFVDIAGAATSPLGNVAASGTSGNQTTNGTLATTVITPSQANGLIICNFGVTFGTFYGVNGVNSANGNALWQAASYPQLHNDSSATATAASPLSEDQSLVTTIYNSNTTAWTLTFAGAAGLTGGASYWSAAAIEVKSASPTASIYASTFVPPIGTTTLNGTSGQDMFLPIICPAGVTSTASVIVWGGCGAGARGTSATGAAGKGGGCGGDCATAPSFAVTPGNVYIFALGGGGTTGATPFSGAWATQCLDDATNLPSAATGKSAAANSATGASTKNGTTTAGTGGVTHTGGSGATGTSSGGGGGGGGGGTTGNGGAGAVTAGGAAGTGSPAAGAGGAGGASGSNHAGTIGNAPGGAGGGAFWVSGTQLGGNGVPGQARITFTAAIISFDAVSNSGYQSAVSSLSWSHTWNGTNRFLAIDIALLSVNDTVSAMTYGGATCTNVGAKTVVGGTGRIENWRICQNDASAPAAGSNTISVTLSGSVAAVGAAVSYTGVNQTGPTEAWNGNSGINTGTGTNATVVVTTITNNDWVHAALATNAASGIAASQTSRNVVNGTLGTGANSDTGPITPAAAQTMTYTGEGITSAWVVGGYGIVPAAAVPPIGRTFNINQAVIGAASY